MQQVDKLDCRHLLSNPRQSVKPLQSDKGKMGEYSKGAVFQDLSESRIVKVHMATLALARPHSYKKFSRTENFALHVDVCIHPLPP